MEQRISMISMGVNDLQVTKGFYNALGWQVANEGQGEEIVAYNLPGIVLALYPWDKLAEDATVTPERSGYSSMTIAYNVKNEAEVDAMLTAAQSAGGKIVKPAEKVFWGGYSGYFADPDDHLWEVAYNPFSPLGDNGEFQWGG